VSHAAAHAEGANRPPICVIFNPTAKGEGAKRALRHLEAMREQCAFKPTFAAGTARTLATEAVREGYQTVVAMGGDGTVNEVLNGITDHPDGLLRTRVGVLPVGTVNVFARELGLPLRFGRAWKIVCSGREIKIDIPLITFQTAQGSVTRFFAQMAGCGLDARAVELVSWQLKKRIGQFAYVVAGIRALREPAARIQVLAGQLKSEGELVLIGNGRFYGGPVPIFRKADLRDGLLDVCVFPKVNWLVILRYACAYLSPRLLHQGPEQHLQVPSVRLESAQRIPVQLDGESVGHLPAECTVRRQVLRVLVP
jgi:diacylglycerol kinase (ATP)